MRQSQVWPSTVSAQAARGGEPCLKPVAGGAGSGYIAGGVESMSRVPMMSDGGAVGVDPSFTFDNYFVPQGIGADIIATEYGFTRDMADEMAVESQRRAKAAWDDNRFEKSVVPVRDVNWANHSGP